MKQQLVSNKVPMIFVKLIFYSAKACPNKKKDKFKKETVILKETSRCLNNIEQ